MKKMILTTVIATGLLTSSAFADGHGKNKHFGKGHQGPGKIYKRLDLTDSQQTQIKAIFKDARMKDDRKAHFSQRQQMMQQRQALIEAPTLDKAALEQLANQRGETMKIRFVKMAEAEHKAWQILTPEQQTKAKAMMKKRQERMQKRAEKHEKRRDNHHD